MSQALQAGLDVAAGAGVAVERVCARTGLVLRPAARQQIWRVAKSSYGALNPLPRDPHDDRAEWGRYDVAGHRTAYGASPREATYGEALASQRLKFKGDDDPSWGHLFDDPPPRGVDSLLDAIKQEWEREGYMPPGTVSGGWRHDRLVYELRLPHSGWFIDIERVESIAAISRALRANLAAFDLEHLSVGHLRSERRALTTTIAGWLRDQVLDDGSLPHGVQFASKHDSTWTCWAIWLRALDDGKPVTAEPTKADSGTEIKGCDQNHELHRIVQLFDLKCF